MDKFLNYLKQQELALDADIKRCKTIADDAHEEGDDTLADLYGYHAASQHHKATMVGKIRQEYLKQLKEQHGGEVVHIAAPAVRPERVRRTGVR